MPRAAAARCRVDSTLKDLRVPELPARHQSRAWRAGLDVQILAALFYSLYALTFFNLDPGMTLADLMPETIRGPIPPAWAGLFAETSSGLPGRSTTFDMLVTKGPVYAICWSQPPDLPIGSLGPFEVSE